MKRFETANSLYTGGNIWLFYGKLADGNFFVTDDDGWVTILDADPSIDWEARNTIAWVADHTICCLTEEDSRIEFCNALADRLLSNNPADLHGGIEDDEIEAYRKYWKEPF